VRPRAQITVALSVFKDDAGYAAGIPLIYGAIEPMVIAPFCLLAWKLGWTYCPPDRPFLEWLLGNFQPPVHGPEERQHERASDVASTISQGSLKLTASTFASASAGSANGANGWDQDEGSIHEPEMAYQDNFQSRSSRSSRSASHSPAPARRQHSPVSVPAGRNHSPAPRGRQYPAPVGRSQSLAAPRSYNGAHGGRML
jgi:hypothetical protein